VILLTQESEQAERRRLGNNGVKAVLSAVLTVHRNETAIEPPPRGVLTVRRQKSVSKPWMYFSLSLPSSWRPDQAPTEGKKSRL
jgi:hypothetical protein